MQAKHSKSIHSVDVFVDFLLHNGHCHVFALVSQLFHS